MGDNNNKGNKIFILDDTILNSKNLNIPKGSKIF